MKFRSVSELYEYLRVHSPRTLILSGMDSAVAGVVDVGDGLLGIVYDYDIVLEIVSKTMEISYDDSVVYFERSLYPLFKQHKNPLFCSVFSSQKCDTV